MRRRETEIIQGDRSSAECNNDKLKTSLNKAQIRYATTNTCRTSLLDTTLTRTVVLNLFHCWDPLNATDFVWNPQVKIEKACAPE